jgi:hypothetical protein
LHKYSPHGHGSGKKMYTYRFDDGCATQITPAFDAFLYYFALRVAVKSPSVSRNLDTTKQSGQSKKDLQSGRRP